MIITGVSSSFDVLVLRADGEDSTGTYDALSHLPFYESSFSLNFSFSSFFLSSFTTTHDVMRAFDPSTIWLLLHSCG